MAVWAWKWGSRVECMNATSDLGRRNIRRSVSRKDEVRGVECAWAIFPDPPYLQISPGWWSHVLFEFKFLQPFCSTQAYLFVIFCNFYGPLRNTTNKRNIEEETDFIFHETSNTRRRRWKILIFGPRESIYFIIMKVIWKKHASWAEMCSRYPS